MLPCIVVLLFLDAGVATLPSLSNILPDLPNPADILPEIPNPVHLLFQNKCIEAIGCFYTGPPFYHPINRPLSLTPTSVLKTKFMLFTPANAQEGQEINLTTESIRNSSLNSQLPIKVLVHGFRSDLDVDDIRFDIKDALLNASAFNIIVVDWTEHNGHPYAQAVANARAVGAQLGHLLNLIMNVTGIRANDIHLIGHSLGGHISGWAGELIPGLGRITGLDPAGPLFQNVDNLVRLDATDALFVDIIHSDGGENIVDGLGIGDPIGHMDFYPNGGRRQPGCAFTSESDSLVGSVINMTTKWLSNGCDHERANKFFLESIKNSKCRFLATWCNCYDDFEKGDCLPQNSTLAEMGFHARRIPGVPMKSKFFLRTNGTSSFCIQNSVYL